MICLPIPVEVANQVVLEGEGAEPVENLHITLFALGKAADLAVSPDAILGVLREVAASSQPLVGVLGGIGRFAGQAEDGGDPVFLSVDVPGLNEFRDRVGQALKILGVTWKDNHGYTPHMTLSYTPKDADMPLQRVDAVPVAFNEVGFWVGDDRKNVSMGSQAARVAARHQAALTGTVQNWLVKYFSRPENKKWLSEGVGAGIWAVLKKLKAPTPELVLGALVTRMPKEFFLDDRALYSPFSEELEDIIQVYLNRNAPSVGLLEIFPEFIAKGAVFSSALTFYGELLDRSALARGEEPEDIRPAIGSVVSRLGGKLKHLDNWRQQPSMLGPVAGYDARVEWAKASDIVQAVFTPVALTTMASRELGGVVMSQSAARIASKYLQSSKLFKGKSALQWANLANELSMASDEEDFDKEQHFDAAHAHHMAQQAYEAVGETDDAKHHAEMRASHRKQALRAKPAPYSISDS